MNSLCEYKSIYYQVFVPNKIRFIRKAKCHTQGQNELLGRQYQQFSSLRRQERKSKKRNNPKRENLSDGGAAVRAEGGKLYSQNSSWKN